MKRALLFLLALLSLFLAGCTPQELGGKAIFDGTHTLTMVDGDLVITGGHVTLPESSEVVGSIYMGGGTLEVNGTIRGDVSALAGTILIGSRAHIGGRLNQAGAEVRSSPGSVIAGGTHSGVALPTTPGWWQDQSFPMQAAWLAGRALFMGLLAGILVRFGAQGMNRMRRATQEHAIAAASLGLLSLVAGISAAVFMAFTIVLIPVAVLAIVLGAALLAVGWAAVGALAGEWLLIGVQARVAPAVRAATGAFVFTVVILALERVPVLGPLIVAGVASLGVGAVLLTHVGRRTFAPAEPDL